MLLENLTRWFDTGVASTLVGVVAGLLGMVAALFGKRSADKLMDDTKLKIIDLAIRKDIPDQPNSSVEHKENQGYSNIDEKIKKAIEARSEELLKGAKAKIDVVSGLITSYHHQALSQAKIQFWFSVAAATVGFIYILIAASTSANAADGIFRIVPGAVIDAVAFLFFKQSEQTRERATALYDRLRQDNQIERASELVNSIEDMNVRSLVKAQIALHSSGLTPKDLDLQIPRSACTISHESQS